ncbi:uncharacterized protein [Clytia hemisphaerica]|uniref:Uncharacterized protein n=3 Tax=Clytia hemisphaerica TaxID=252671 RepID=A0A7M5UR49_9CNID
MDGRENVEIEIESESDWDSYEDENPSESELDSDVEIKNSFATSAMDRLGNLLSSITENNENEQITKEIHSALSMVHQSGIQYFGYLLENDNSRIEKGIESLKGVDQFIVRSMEKGSKELPEAVQFSFHLAELTRTVTNETRTNSHGEKIKGTRTINKVTNANNLDGSMKYLESFPINIKESLLGRSETIDWGTPNESLMKKVYSRFIVIAIAKKHYFETLCSSYSPLPCIQFLMEEQQTSHPDFKKHLRLFLREYPANLYVEHQSDTIVVISNLLKEAQMPDLTLLYLKQVIISKVKHEEKLVYQICDGIEEPIAELFKSVSWEDVKETVEKVVEKCYWKQHVKWLDIASKSGINEIADIVICIAFDKLEKYDDLPEPDLWFRIFEQVFKGGCLFDSWFDSLLTCENILTSMELTGKLCEHFAVIGDPFLSFLMRCFSNSIQFQEYMDLTEQKMEEFTNISMIFIVNYDRSKKELTELCDTLIDTGNFSTLGSLLINICKRKLSNTAAFDMMFEKYFDEVSIMDPNRDFAYDEIDHCSEILLRSKYSKDVRVTKIFLDLCKRFNDPDDLCFSIRRTIDVLLVTEESEIFLNVLTELFEYFLGILENLTEEHLLKDLITSLFGGEGDVLSNLLDDLLSKEFVSPSFNLLEVYSDTLSELCLEDNRQKLKKLKANKNFQKLFLNYCKLLPAGENQNFDFDKYSNVIVFLVENNDWEHSTQLLHLFLDLNVLMNFKNCYQVLSHMKPRNTENYKMFLKKFIDALKIFLEMENIWLKEIFQQTYQEIRKFVRIVFKNECFSDLIPNIIDALEPGVEVKYVPYKEKNILQMLLHDLKNEFESKGFYADMMLILVLNFIKSQEKDGLPKLSWKQQFATIQGHDRVTQFLRSNEATYIYDHFENIDEAVEWIKRYAGIKLSQYYSFTAVARKHLGNVEVIIQKGREIYQMEKDTYFEKVKEFERLKKKLKKFPTQFSKMSNFKLPLRTSGNNA